MTTREDHRSGIAGRMGHAALALGVLLVAGGCAPRQIDQADRYRCEYRFTLGFGADGCPTSAVSDHKNCNDAYPPNHSSQRPDCVRVLREQRVTFASDQAFGVQFGPFEEVVLKSSRTSEPLLPHRTTLQISAPRNRDKPYYFNVRPEPPKACTLDPQIIVD